MTSLSPTTSANVKGIIAAFEFTRMQRELERRRQRLEKLFTTTSVASATPPPAPLVALSSPALSTTPPSPTPTASASIDNTTLSSSTTRGPRLAPPARCSTLGRTNDESTRVPVSTASAPSSTSSRASSAPSAALTFPLTAATGLCAKEEIFTTMPTKCSTNCFNRDNMLKFGNTINKCSSLENMQHRWKLSWAYGIGVSEWNHWSPRICMSSVMLYSVMSAQPAYDDSLVDDSDNFSVSEMTMLKFLAMTWHCSACVHVVLLKFTHKWKHKKAIFKLLLLWGNQTVKMTIRIISFAMFTANDKIQRKTRLIVWTVEANDILHHIMMSVQLS
ncbi:hypothetical protein PVAP13_3KG428000 [Panicum virgatum]|uniref:Uncharacterized protein n=1 Tax=Panicum virgatum TaxID=38727 RepID=A0A8T0V539_PANVG|nr:hypothetical protein PVAP13_3KG428000 [Panicum virgatum]